MRSFERVHAKFADRFRGDLATCSILGMAARRAVRLGLLTAIVLVVTACEDWPQILWPQATATPATETMPEQPPQVTENTYVESMADQPILFEHVSLEQGLSQSSVFSILQDSTGFMWFGTQDGLNRYDGYEFTVYRPIPGEPNSLSHNIILSLYEDREGILWIGTNGGGLDSLELDTGRITRYSDNPRSGRGFSGNVVFAICEDRDGNLWFGTEDGLNRFDRDRRRFTLYENEDGDRHSLSFDAVMAIYQDRDGDLWIGTGGGGLDKLDLQREQFIHYRHDPDDPHSLSSNLVTSIHQDSEGMLWVGTDGGGLNRFDPSTEQFVRYQNDPDAPHSLSSNYVRAILEDRFGTLWIGTEGQGLDRFDRDQDRFIHYQHDLGDPSSLSDDWVWSIYEDRAGVLWIGTLGDGLNKLGCLGDIFVHYQADPNDSNSLSDNLVWAIHQDRKGMLWIGTHGGGLDKYDRRTGRWYHYQHDPDDPDSLSHNLVRSIQEDPEGILWLGTEGGGLNRFNPETERFTIYRHLPDNPHSLSNDDVLTVYIERAGTLWAGTRNGLNRLDRATGHFDQYSFDNNNTIRTVYEDREGTLWIGTEGGLHGLDPITKQVTSYFANPRRRNSLSSGSILSVHEDPAGTLWLGTFAGGLNKFDREEESFTHYRESEGLPSDVVYGVLEDDQGRLWLSTNLGLSNFDPETETFTNYDVNDGLQSNEFNGGAYYKSSGGEMFFGGVNGFNTFYPDGIKQNPYIPPVVLTALRQGGVAVDIEGPVESVEEVTFRWPNNFFEFEFAALSYCQPERNQYAYMLEGLDRDWFHVGPQRSGRYTNLRGKTYTLRIKGSNSDGIWNEEGHSVKVTIVPPLWATWWFRGLAVLVLVGGVIAGYRLRVRSIEARSHELEKQVEERTRALAERTREIERRKQELEALYRADSELHRHLSLDEVLQALVDTAVDILQADKSSLMVWDDQREKLVVRVARGFRPETLAAMTFIPAEGTVGHVAATGKPVAVHDVRTDPRVSKRTTITEPEGIRSFMQVPIKVGGEVFGVFSADYTQPRAFGAEEKRLFLALAQRAALAIDTAQLHEQSQELAVVEERSRLARDLHDAVTQTLFSSSLIAEALPQLWETDREEGRQLLKELRQLSRGALAEMRTLLLELRPAALVETCLGDLLRQLGEAVAGRTGVPVTVSIQGQCAPPSEVHVALYRIAQEALNNVVKHAESSQVDVSLHCTTSPGGDGDAPRNQVELRVSDNGRGFDPDRIPPNRLGLGIIRERAQAIGAVLVVESQVGQGTQVKVVWNDEGSVAEDE